MSVFLASQRQLVLWFFTFLLSGCATVATDHNEQLLADTREPARSLRAIAAGGGEPIAVGTEVRGQLSLESMPLQLESSRGVYKAYVFSATEEASHVLQIDTDCQCGGFSKTLLVPRIVILNASGDIVVETSALSSRSPGWTTPAGMTGSLSWRSTPGDYFVVLISTATTSSPTAAMSATAVAATPGPLVIGGIPIFASPFGPYRLKLTVATQ